MEPLIKALGVAIAVAYFFSLVRVFWVERQLRKIGVSVEGIVLDAYKQVRGSHVICYEYQYGQSRIKQTRSVGYKTFSKLKKSSTVKIKYLPDNPRITRISGDFTDRQVLIFLGFFVFPLVSAMLRV